MSAQPQKNEEVVPVQKSQLDSKTQQKLISLILCFVAFVIMYFALSSGSETFMWISLILTVAVSGLLYAKN